MRWALKNERRAGARLAPFLASRPTSGDPISRTPDHPANGYGLVRRRARRLLLMLCAASVLEAVDWLKPVGLNYVAWRDRPTSSPSPPSRPLLRSRRALA